MIPSASRDEFPLPKNISLEEDYMVIARKIPKLFMLINIGNLSVMVAKKVETVFLHLLRTTQGSTSNRRVFSRVLGS